MSDNDQMTITEFLDARIAEDEAVALEAARLVKDLSPTWYFEDDVQTNQPEPLSSPLVMDDDSYDGSPIIIIRGSRVHAECAAKRAILDYHSMLLEQSEQAEVFGYHATGLLVAIRKLSAAYADHPDYQQEWAL